MEFHTRTRLFLKRCAAIRLEAEGFIMTRVAWRAGRALAAAAFAAGSLMATSAPAAPDVPTMTIKIYNNSANYNIYPVLTTGTSSSSLWLQAWFKVPKAQLGNKPYPKLNNFRIYINPTGKGIPPKGSVTVTLPLLTQLVPTAKVDPKKTDQYIDWWGGGRVEIFDAPTSTGQPPAALTALYEDRPSQTAVDPILNTPVPTCDGCKGDLVIFKDTGGGFMNNEPSQLTEYTLGAINQTKDPFELNTNNVDIDVSYVDTAYLPAAMTPYNTTLPPIAQIGYVGTPQPIGTFRSALQKFTAENSPYVGWPQFINNQGKKILKIPSVMHVFSGDPNMTPGPWKPITQLTTNWNACLSSPNSSQYCKNMISVRNMFTANYNNYRKIYNANCDTKKDPVVLTEALMIQHVYGFTPFGENCANPKVNLLENTPGYSDNGSAKFHQVKDLFDGLQYWPSGKFDPYVVLIHGKDYVDAPNVYAYSVDDAVGNLQAEGTGFIIAVAGTNGLPNPNPAAPPININFGFSTKDKVRFVKYGVCSKTPTKDVDPDFASFGLSVDAKNLGQCPISFIDNKGALYTFKLKSGPPFPYGPNKLTPATHAPIDCSGSGPSSNWCEQIFAYSEKPVGSGPDASYVITPAPPQPSR
jgi:hypothetical protein